MLISQAQKAPIPKSIVLFSDGTGNSASKPFKTNVWRTYQALEIDEPPEDQRLPAQIAYYRDGVGTETFKPIALVGGALGLGVMRDLRALYTFVCRNYAEGDKIHCFGFSRGAFTIRLLVGLIARCGILHIDDEAQLRRAVALAYNAFRRDVLIRASRTRGMIYNHIVPPPRYDDKDMICLPFRRIDVDIDFLGVWDTVDAYGMPVEELKDGIDQWIWPLSFADRELSCIVKCARHALSLDDERPAFTPVLWNEHNAPPQARLKQVWFPGVHANVGGGYPIDDLAFVPLAWMMEEAQKAGLRFKPGELDKIRTTANAQGPAYNSRSGVAGYYRYGPRDVDRLCKDHVNKVAIANPMMHEAVTERIAQRQVCYAPVSVPRDFVLPGTTGVQDAAFVECAADAVFWRRVVYFATVFVTLALVLLPLLKRKPTDAYGRVWQAIQTSIPGWSKPWIEAFLATPLLSVPLILLLAWLFFTKSSQLQQWVSDRSEWAWWHVKKAPVPQPPVQSFGDRLARALRKSRGGGAYLFFVERVMPHLVGITMLCAIVTAVAYVVIKFLNALHGWIVTTGALMALAAALVFFFKNVGLRAAIDVALKNTTTPQVPERKPTYDAQYLQTFKNNAEAQKLADGRLALDSYLTPVLLSNDVFFAIGLSIFIVCAGVALKDHFPGTSGLGNWITACGAIYGIADVTEDLVLAVLFRQQTWPITDPRAATDVLWARVATLCKMVFLGASLLGGFVFVILAVSGKLARISGR